MNITKIKKNITKQPVWFLGLGFVLIVSVYWLFVATDRYVSKAHIVLQSPDLAPPDLSFSSMLSGASASNRGDLLLLRDYLLSADVLKLLDADLNLKEHFSNHQIDYFSRMKNDLPIEYFHEYFLKRIDVTMDDYSGVLIVKASAFNPEIAFQIVTKLLSYGEAQMNQMGQRLATEQVNFIEKQVEQLNQQLGVARNAVLAYQNQEGLISPTSTVESLSAVVSELKSQLAKLQAQKSVLSNYQSERSPDMIQLKSQINALHKQIAIESAKLTATQGNALNKVTAEYETLMLRAQFAQEIYSNALATLEGTRVEAARKLKQVSVLQAPAQSEYSIEPNRVYNIGVTALITLLISIILSLMLTIIRDHRD